MDDGAAKEAWAMMVQKPNPLPPYAAVDWLLNGTDGAAERRGECVRALLRAGAAWLDAYRVVEIEEMLGPEFCHVRDALRDIERGLFVGAAWHITRARRSIEPDDRYQWRRTRIQGLLWDRLVRWLGDAQRAVTLMSRLHDLRDLN